MRYATARYNQHQRDWAYRLYVADGVRILTKNTAKAGDQYLSVRFNIYNKRSEDNRSGEEIAADVFNRMGVSLI